MAMARTGINLQDPVTQHMRRDFIRLDAGQTVGQALAGLRERSPEGRIIYFYVVDGDGRLQGVVPTRRLLLSPADKPIADIMVKDVVVIPMVASVLDACEFFTIFHLLAFPVVDGQRRVIGIVDVDLYTEELTDLERSRHQDDLFQLIGVHLTEAQQASPLMSFRNRFPWLLCNIAGGILAAFLAGVYQAELAWQQAVLALFIPVVLALAEGVSMQSVSLAIQTLHGRRPNWSILLNKARRELLTGVYLGAGSALLVGLVAAVWIKQLRVVLCLVGGSAGGVTGAAVIGMAMPNLLRLARRDPHLAAGPIALALSDMITLLLYFSCARWLVA
jgi:magnesium transporter